MQKAQGFKSATIQPHFSYYPPNSLWHINRRFRIKIYTYKYIGYNQTHIDYTVVTVTPMHYTNCWYHFPWQIYHRIVNQKILG